MTDKELLEKAAKAAGLKLEWDKRGMAWCDSVDGWWNPLTDDGDAFRLGVTCEVFTHPNFTRELRRARFGLQDQDDTAAYRLAITRIAAAMAGQPIKFTPREMFAPGAEGCFQDVEGKIPVTAIGQTVGRISSSLPEKLEGLFQDSAIPIGQRVGFVQHRPENMPTLERKQAA